MEPIESRIVHAEIHNLPDSLTIYQVWYWTANNNGWKGWGIWQQVQGLDQAKELCKKLAEANNTISKIVKIEL